MLMEHIHFAGITERRPQSRRPTVPRIEGAPSDASDEPLLDALFAAAGIAIGAYRGKALRRRVPACLRWLRVATAEEAIARIQAKPALVPELLSVVLLGVTEFCRDRMVFDRMAAAVIPDLARRSGRLRVWSAACSDGPELYSVAFLLDRAGMLQRSELLGTDCRASALQRARTGTYPAALLERSDPEWRALLMPVCGGFAVPERLRLAVGWKQADLLRGPERGPWDIILWRNMAIYLQADQAAEIWAQLASQLAPGGYLITGKADHPPRLPDLHKCGPSIWKRVGS